jgi:ADP-ribosylglycohydrolase
MSAENIIFDVGDAQGWNDDTKLALCLRYIDNQEGSPEAFTDFIQTQADEENEESMYNIGVEKGSR